MTADTGIVQIRGIGEKSARLYEKLDIYSVSDLLQHFPRKYETFSSPVPVSEGINNEINSFYCKISSNIFVKKVHNLTITNFKISDETGTLNVTLFNMPYLKKILKVGDYYVFRGLLKNRTMDQPKFFTLENYEKLTLNIQPFYSLTKGLTNNQIRKSVKNALNEFEFSPEALPDWILERYHLMTFRDSVSSIHFPASEENLLSARKSLIFREFLSFLFTIQENKLGKENMKSSYPMILTSNVKRLIENLPYQLTEGQKSALNDIQQDMTGGSVMSRLIQGDVGSGKTIIAVLSLLLCVSNGYQGAMMAPTEVLAEQHYKTVSDMTKKYRLPFKPILLTGSVTSKCKKDCLNMIKSGEANIVIGTQALIQKNVQYKNLALVITDEQHRFGVRQRETFAKKGDIPHVLVMSATPIPRSLAMILYNDLDISVIKDRPSNRLPVKNCVVNTDYRRTAYQFIEKEIENRHQIYIICPMAEESDTGIFEERQNVIDYTEQLKEIFPSSTQIVCLHGKMKPDIKRRIMEDFYNHNIDILVSTTVIEVGINVPNATVMMIENAECFGLAQLHQLRGRIGRGKDQSYCIFINSSDNDNAVKRLNILCHSNDGFYISEEDLKLRGPGDLWGIQQSGAFKFRIADIYRDSSLLFDAKECLKILFEKKAENLSAVKDSLRGEFNMQNGSHLDFQTI